MYDYLVSGLSSHLYASKISDYLFKRFPPYQEDDGVDSASLYSCVVLAATTRNVTHNCSELLLRKCAKLQLTRVQIISRPGIR